MRPRSSSRRCQYFCPLTVCSMFLSCALSPGQQADRETDPPPDAPKASIAESKSFFARWTEFYRGDWSGTAAPSSAPERRGPSSPLDSPPFPDSNWSYGGSPVIGEADTINQARSRTKLYGWMDRSDAKLQHLHRSQCARSERCLLESI